MNNPEFHERMQHNGYFSSPELTFNNSTFCLQKAFL